MSLTSQDVERLFKKQIAEDTKEKYSNYNRIIELNAENQQLKESNRILAEDLKELDLVVDKLKRHEWSFDNDPQSNLKNAIMDIIKDF
jgi:uncharacterized protein YlxW (UPF0749 family)